MTALATTSLAMSGYVWALGITGCVTALSHYLPRAWRDWRGREHAGATEAYADELKQHRVLLTGQVPIVPGLVHIAPSPLARYKTHHSDDTATTRPGYQPRHLSLGPRDPAMDARLTTTAIFDAIAESEGAPVRVHGPREDDIRCVRQVAPAWQQATLDLSVVAR